MTKFDTCAACILKDRPIVLEDYIDNNSDQTIMLIGEAPGYTVAMVNTGGVILGRSS
jgi:uracil-DNA glycosylase